MKQTDRVMTALMAGLLLLLLLASLGAVLLNTAGQLQREMLQAVTQRFEENGAVFSDAMENLPDGATEEERDWAVYLALHDMSQNTTVTGYPIAAADYVVCEQRLPKEDGVGYTPVRTLGGNNLVLLEFTDREGDSYRIPAHFAADNSADVAQLFSRYAYINQYGTNVKHIKGLWRNGTFFLAEISSRPRTQSYPEERLTFAVPEDAWEDITDYVILESDARLPLILPISKYNGRANSNYAAAWERDDRLVAEIQQLWTYRSFMSRLEFPKNSLTRVTGVGVVSRFLPLGEDPEGEVFSYTFGVSFSPLALAWHEILINGTIVLPLLFLIIGGLLIWAHSALRRAEIRSFQDEIARREQALSYARSAEQSRREMTSAIAHELKTPIAILSSYAEGLEENIDPEKQKKYLSVIQDEAARMDRMVLELLDLSRLEAGKYKLRREDFDLEALTRQILEPLESRIAEKHLQLQWQVDNPTVNADPYRMGQVVENFLTNAIRHTPEGGRIILRIGTQRETFSVENQGKGIPAENLSKVWETFWQGDTSRSEKGSGLGLAICRTIVTLHGGTCKAENTATGVRFSISLDKNRKLYQLGRMPTEEEIHLQFPVGLTSVTVERVMTKLGLVSPKLLAQELKDGNVKVGTEVVRDPRQKLYPGYILLWREYRITIIDDDSERSRAMLMDRMRPGSLGNVDMAQNGSITVGH